MALGETHVIALTKATLSEAGVDVGALEAAAAAGGKQAVVGGKAVARSQTTLIVKNLPFSAVQRDLQVSLRMGRSEAFSSWEIESQGADLCCVVLIRASF